MKYTNEVIDTFKKNTNSAYAEKMNKYMKGKFEFFGIKAPLRREISKPFFKEEKLPKVEELEKLIPELWNLPEREFQYFAIDLLMKYKTKIDKTIIQLYLWMIKTKSWWDTVDPIAINLIGPYFEKYNQKKELYVHEWIHSEDLWLQRTSVIFQLKYKQNTDITLLEQAITHCKDSKEFFLKKAVGWALREYAKTDETFVRNFVEQIQLQPLSKNEALRNIIKTPSP